MRSSVRTEAIARFRELRFINNLKHLAEGLLDYSVYYRWYAKTTFLSIRLGYLYPSDGIWFICAFANGRYQLTAMLSQIWK